MRRQTYGYLPSLSRLLIAPTPTGMARLSWPVWLATYRDSLPAWGQSSIHLATTANNLYVSQEVTRGRPVDWVSDAMADNNCSSWITSSIEHAGSSASSCDDGTRLRLPTVDVSAAALTNDSDRSVLSAACWLYSCNKQRRMWKYHYHSSRLKYTTPSNSITHTHSCVYLCTYKHM